MKPTENRTHYLDLIKGFCMLLVIADHAAIVDPASSPVYRMLDQIEVVAFFFVSGLLFKRVESDKIPRFILRKGIRLIIPFIFFLGLFIAVAMLPRILSGKLNAISLYHTIITPANGPLWFLRSLFIAITAYALLDTFILRKVNLLWQTAIILFITCIGLIINHETTQSDSTAARLWIDLNFASAAISMIWIWLGNIISRNRTATIDRINGKSKPALILLLITAAIWAICSMPGMALHRGITPHPLFFYPAAAAGCIFLLITSIFISHIKPLNYIGRNSIVVLGTHYIILAVCAEIILLSPFVNLIITLALMPPVIAVINRFFPWINGK